MSIFAAFLAAAPLAASPQLDGAGGPNDPLTVTVNGPALDEAQGANPFADYRLDVTFSDGKAAWTVPGYFDGCGTAADDGCTGGTVWRAHFLPPHPGTWTWRIGFTQGRDVAATDNATGVRLRPDGMRGRFTVAAQSRDAVGARGTLRYTGDAYYRWSGSGAPFFKFGPDAPENTLAYSGFDATSNAKGLRKDWAPHERDFDAAAAPYLWRDGQGRGLLGMMRYLADSKLNTVSMLLFNVGGDDRNVVPQLFAVSEAEYAEMKPGEQWRTGVVHDRYDVSKLAQWRRALAYGDALGLALHLKLQETENDQFMDGGDLGRERRIYLREMIARFGAFRGVTWNLGEENTQTPDQVRAMAAYVDRIDPYDHPIVLHTFPEQKERYRPLLGAASSLNGFSLQGQKDDFADIRPDIVQWRTASDLTGRRWPIGYDEPGSAAGGAGVDPGYPDSRLPSKRDLSIPRERFRREVIWNTLTAGGDGVEAYYGYRTGCTDLNCQDHRTRAELWRDGVRGREFFETHIGARASGMRAEDGLTADPTDYVFAEAGRTYLIYTTAADRLRLSLLGFPGQYTIEWFDPTGSSGLEKGSLATIDVGTDAKLAMEVALGAPPRNIGSDWVVLLRRVN
ncbi:hypothetical protein A6F68_00817 [Tsuneonella dongtanensis]|uniref:DUF5060 domain-containing protein n=1 Tax=Tsuneonella dongtanensis TaxID=692370 RepID=A0A1B2AAZ3_9SPHN|nr:DUF5060 domain-containing protein [Tsuneonella dongtanensis]ANY19343.1 hypothetical protein A6F68_00817 [Tsuneonella dongtanensis]